MNRRLELVNHRQPMVIVEKEIPEPPPGGAVVKLHFTGICHSDVIVWEDVHDMGDGRIFRHSDDPNSKYPLVMGHEMAGEIYTLGSEVSKDTASLKVGDHVMVYPWGGCGKCIYCREESLNGICTDPSRVQLGFQADGGYQKYVSVEQTRFLLPVPASVPMEVAALLPCSGVTAYNAVRKIQRVIEGATSVHGLANVLIVGAGGLGLWGIQIARSLLPEGTKIIVAEISETKFEAAREAGADETILWDPSGSNKDRIGACRQLVGDPEGGMDAAIDFVGSSVSASSAYGCLQKNGTLVLVGLSGGAMLISAPLMPLWNLSVIGVKVGKPGQLREITQLVASGKVVAPPIDQVALEDTNQVIQDLIKGKRKGRTVIRHL